MNVTIDLKSLLIALVLIALVVMIVYIIIVLRKLLVTLEETNRVLKDAGEISEIAARRSHDLDGIIGNVSSAATDLSGSMKKASFISTVSSVAKSAASLKGMMSGDDAETRAAKKSERRSERSR